MSIPTTDTREWLETDGLGGFASGTAGGLRTRRYHALLVAAANPPTERFSLVADLEVRVQTAEGEVLLTRHAYAPGVIAADPRVTLERFTHEPWPRWTFRLPGGVRIVHELFMTRGAPRVVLTWRAADDSPGATLRVRPLLSGRDYHALHHENHALRFTPDERPGRLRWSLYPGVPAVLASHNGAYAHDPVWYRRAEYAEESRRGFDSVEDLAAPGVLTFDLAAGEAALVLSAQPDPAAPDDAAPEDPSPASLRHAEAARRRAFPSPLHRAADQYLVRGARGGSIIAGYPWFADWGRDTFIALRGLCLAAGRFDEARDILLAWAGAESGGLLPNRFPDRGTLPEYNSVDAGLWFIVAACELMRDARAAGRPLPLRDEEALSAATQRILDACARGTMHAVRMDADGLLAAGEPGVQLTWMDARVGERVVTPRVGKPVEIQALWLSTLRIGAAAAPKWLDVYETALRSFQSRFWCPSTGCLRDVVDADHAPGADDDSIRPNQVLAVGGLPWCFLPEDLARRVVDRVEAVLLTPLGLRSLAPDHPDYAPRYAGTPAQRDGAYHQGTVWPWLLGPFVEAWVRVRGNTPEARAQARERFLTPVLAHLQDAGLGHVSEIADGAAPHTPGGCPFQAWSLGEVLRLDQRVLADPRASSTPPPGRAGEVRTRRPSAAQAPRQTARKV